MASLVQRFGGKATMPEIEPRFRCVKCGNLGATIRVSFQDDSQALSQLTRDK